METEPDINEPSQGLRDFWLSPRLLRMRRVIGLICYRIYRLLGEATAIVLGLGIVLSYVLASTLDRQSTDISILRPNLQIWFAEAFDGNRAEFGRLDIKWLPAREAFVLTAEDISITDDAGLELEGFELLRGTFTWRPEDLRRPKLVNVEIKGGVLSYVEDDAGRITVGLGPPETVGRIGPVYRSDETAVLGGSVDLNAFESLMISEAKVFIRNAVSGLDLVSDIDRLAASFSDEGNIVYTATGRIEQAEEPAKYVVSGVSDMELSAIRTIFSLMGARPDELAPTRGRFFELRGLSAPVDLSGSVEFSRLEGLKSAALNLDIDAGTLSLLREDTPRELNFESLNFDARLEPGNDRMQINRLDLSSPGLRFKGSGFFTQLGNLNDGDINSSPEFDLSLENIRVRADSIFENPLRIKSLEVKGQADFDGRTLVLRDSRLALFDAVFNFQSDLQLLQDNRPKSFALKLDMGGGLAAQELMSLWPVNAVDGARQWLVRAFIGGRVEDLSAELNFDEAFYEDRALTPERVQVSFSANNADILYMGTMPPALGLTMQGRIVGNRLDIDVSGGRVETIALESGTVAIPELNVRGSDIIVTGSGRGQAPEMLKLLENEPFRLATRYGFEPDEVAGDGVVNVVFTRPLRVVVPRESVRYDIKGEFTDVKAPFNFGRFDVRQGNIRLEASPDSVTLSGPINLGPWRADVRWHETFGDNPPPTEYSATGQVTADVLDGLGIASRGWFDGSANLRVDATGRNMNVEQAQLDVDLTDAALSAERIWMKPRGEPAQLSGWLSRDEIEGYEIRDASLEGEGLSLKGSVAFAKDFRLKQLDLSDVQIEGLVEGKVRVVPDRGNSRLSIDIDGKLLDVGPWTQDAFATRRSNFDVPLLLRAKIDQLILDPDYAVRQADIIFSHTGKVIDRATLKGTTDSGPLSVELTTLPTRNRQVDVTVPDASNALSAFLGLTNTTGGELRLQAELSPAGEDGAFKGEAQMRNFRLIEAPAMAQLLSLASLTGLADTLSGGGMQFDRFTIPFSVLGDEIAVRDARLYGPALGMTGDGDINLDLRVADFDGTIVPSYTANSILGDIPVLGDLFVREKDGGLFALTYTVSGPFEKTQIAVNPLSALTPGFLRRIFKPDRNDMPDDLQEKIEDVAPPPLEAAETP